MISIIKKYALSIVIGLTLIACLYAFFQFLIPLDVFQWDEAHHGLYGMQIYNDVKAGDWEQFWTHTNNQALWMPLHSWLDAVFLLLFGFSYAAARSSSLFLFACCSLLTFLIGRELSREKGWLIGLIAVGLFLTSPILLHFATQNMQEMLGMVLTLGLAYFMLRYADTEKPGKYLVIGLMIGIAYWSKSNYALQLVLGVGLFQLSLLWPGKAAAPLVEPAKGKKHQKKQPKPAASRNIYYSWLVDNLLIIAGFLPLFLLWWVTPPFDRKYGLGFTFRAQAMTDPSMPQTGFFDALAFHLQSLVSSYSISFWTGLGLLAAIIISFWFYRERKIRAIQLLFLGNLLLLCTVAANVLQERYLSTGVPLAFLLFAYFAVHYYERIRASKHAVAVKAGLALLILMIAVDCFSLTGYTKEVADRSSNPFVYTDSLNKFDPPFLFGLAKRPSFTLPACKLKQSGSFKAVPRSKLSDILDYFGTNIDKTRPISTRICMTWLSPYTIYWHFHDWQAPVLSELDRQGNPRYFWSAEYFIDIEAAADSPYYNELHGTNLGDDEVGRALIRAGYIKLIAQKEFADLGLTAQIYQKTRPINFN
jgi:hypothetical protein